MINPNIIKLVTVEIKEVTTPNDLWSTAEYRGYELGLHLWHRTLKPGKRRLYLKYSICSNSYYLTDRG